MWHTFESLGYQSGFCLSQLFSLNRNGSSLSTIPSKQSTVPMLPPPPLFNWSQQPLPTATNMTLASPNFQNPVRLGFQQPKDETHMFLLPRSSETRMEDMMVEHENDIKWPNGLIFFSALTGRTEDAKLLFNSESLGNKPETNHHPLILEGKDSNQNSDILDSHPENTR
ncbi:serine/threonine-protein kinase dst1-like isoform X1 [Hibiscus syriacus]|uniref:Serine/threonine-protein kinase dst1-like isoform X1 n=1 Tax=Hibiscus syriacus TaxID=106335 RepID=A0A6A2Z4X2_HIBSY|nr:serine/threonine-protein kinase dst1-like isoform X1 [Hibiscus syriacus]